MDPSADDVAAIRQLMERQFAALSWTPERRPDWPGFAADFLDGAVLCPSKRPAAPVTVAAFVDRMRNLSQAGLRSLEERLAGCEVRVFGNVAVAVAVNEMRENGEPPGRVVEMALLVRDGAGWRIAAQAWDGERDGRNAFDALAPRP
jgi:hypothetical protein